MKKLFRFLLIFIVIAVIIIGSHIFYLSTLAAKEKYPADDYLLHEPDKKALIIVAHDDDMITSAGTMKMLTDAGWNIREMCFYQYGDKQHFYDSSRNLSRKRSLQEVAEIQGLTGIDPVDFNFRYDMEFDKPYEFIPYDSFPAVYNSDSLSQLIGAYIDEHKPSLLFTLDDVMGGYGHPEHILMSQLVVKYCKEHRYDTGFSVKRIYQAVFPPSLSENIMKGMSVYQQAKKGYQVAGMPEPDVEINIYPYAKVKKQCLIAYKTEQNSLRKIWPYYHWYPASIYFRIFDRDFYRVIDVEAL